jgi:RNA polymerase sigma-70 factor (ECF subfamily)
MVGGMERPAEEIIHDEQQAVFPDDLALAAALRAGDEGAFLSLVEAHHAAFVRLARTYVPSQAVAEDVAQEAWVAVLEGLDRFEGRSSLRTWIFRILINRAISRGQRERRSIAFSSLFDAETDPFEPAVDPARFRGPGDRWPGYWSRFPRPWDEMPETLVESKEVFAKVSEAIESLPWSQREVITMRDVDGMTSREVCNVLGITETNQRVLLHRARSKVRLALEQYLDEGE